MSAVEARQVESASELAGNQKLAWESPEAVEIDLGGAEHANTNSNFDGTNFSS